MYKSGKSILVIDVEGSNLSSFKAELEPGFRLLYYKDAYEALSYFLEVGWPDIVVFIIDKDTAYRCFLKILKHNCKQHSIPLIFILSGKNEYISGALKCKFLSYLGKPFQLKDLSLMINRHFGYKN